MSVLVFVEIKNKLSKAGKEAITYGKNLGEVNVVTYGNTSHEVLSEMGDYGAKNILVYKTIQFFFQLDLTCFFLKAPNHMIFLTI